MAHRVSSRELVGRQEELAVLTALVERAVAGEGGAALVTGVAGVGKSRLVVELGRRAREAGALVLVGECVDLAEAELPHAPGGAAPRGPARGRAGPVGPGRPRAGRALP